MRITITVDTDKLTSHEKNALYTFIYLTLETRPTNSSKEDLTIDELLVDD